LECHPLTANECYCGRHPIPHAEGIAKDENSKKKKEKSGDKKSKEEEE